MNQAQLIAALSPVMLLVEQGVLLLLILLGIAVLLVFIWRWRAIAAARGDHDKWMKALSARLDAGVPDVAVTAADEKTLPGRVVKTGLSNLGLAPEALEQVFAVQESAEKRQLEAGVSFLGTVGSNAPFLGLTGTVIGILVAFQRFAASGGKGSTEVMVAISGALIATAIGLVVAIPAVVFYNVLRNKIKDVLDRSREIRGMIVARSLHASSRSEG